MEIWSLLLHVDRADAGDVVVLLVAALPLLEPEMMLLVAALPLLKPEMVLLAAAHPLLEPKMVLLLAYYPLLFCEVRFHVGDVLMLLAFYHPLDRVHVCDVLMLVAAALLLLVPEIVLFLAGCPPLFWVNGAHAGNLLMLQGYCTPLGRVDRILLVMLWSSWHYALPSFWLIMFMLVMC